MGNKTKIILGISLAVIFLLAIAGGSFYVMKQRGTSAEAVAAKQEQQQAAASQEKKQLTLDEQVEEILASMSPTEKIGQLMMIGLPGPEVDDEARYVFHQFHYGGVVLFDRNLESKEQARAFVMDIQSGADEKVPLFIAIDEEGGDVVRGASFLKVPPSQAKVGSSSDPDWARRLAVQTAGELRGIGVNVNFAPVADLGSGSRSYSSDPYEALKYLEAAGTGWKEGGMVYALKHFPGIGRGQVDSHEEVSSIEASEHELKKSDLVPFREMINETDKGRTLDYMVMVGHLKYPAFDGGNSASMSKAVITGLLRKEMGYQGLVVTDDLEMGAVTNHLTFREAGAKALLAGADMLLVCHEYAHAEEVFMGIYEALQEGRLSEKQLDESVRRVLKCKLRHGLRPAN